ncbi:GTPase Der [Capsicum galapagoense]
MLLRNLKPLFRRRSRYIFGILSRTTSNLPYNSSCNETIGVSSINSTNIKHVQFACLPNAYFICSVAKLCTSLSQEKAIKPLDNATVTASSSSDIVDEKIDQLLDNRAAATRSCSDMVDEKIDEILRSNAGATSSGMVVETTNVLLDNRAAISTDIVDENADELLGNGVVTSSIDMVDENTDELLDNAAAISSDMVDEKPDELLDSGVVTSSDIVDEKPDELLDNDIVVDENVDERLDKVVGTSSVMVDFTKIDINKLPRVLIMGRPNVGKSALFNRLIRRREALVYNTPTDHVTRDIREGVAKLGNLRFKVLDSAGIEAEASSGSVLGRTAEMTGNVLSKTQFVILLVDARDGVLPMDLDVGKWLRKNAPGMKTIVVMNKAESLDDCDGSLGAAVGDAYNLGFGEPIALSAETGLGMAELHETLRPLLEEYVIQNNICDDEIKENEENNSSEDMESKLPLQLAIVGRPNVGKSTLLNTILQEDRVLVGPEAGLTRDSIRAEFEYEGRTIYLVDTAGWLERTKQQEKGPASLSIMQSRKHLMRAHVVVLVLDAEEIAKARRSMKHVEVVIARRAVEEGRGLVVIVNKMDLLRGKENYKLYKSVIEAVPQEIQTVIPQVTGIPVVFVSALEAKSQIAVMTQVVETYEKWCLRLSTARLNRWLRKVMSRHSWKDQAAQPKIKYFTQVKARPPTFIAFMSGKTQLSDTDLRFLTRSLKEDFDLGGIPVRILQRTVEGNSRTNISSKNKQPANRTMERDVSDKRTILAVESSNTT